MKSEKIMPKLFLVFIMLSISLYAQGALSLLKKVENNSALHMSYKQQDFVCKPYGVETVEELLERSDVNSSCKYFLNEFRKEHPKEKVFAASSLHQQQLYSVSGIKQRCLLHLSTGYSYSEALLERGYARVLPDYTFTDVILKYRFTRAVKRAKINRAGLWSDTKVKDCFLRPITK